MSSVPFSSSFRLRAVTAVSTRLLALALVAAEALPAFAVDTGVSTKIGFESAYVSYGTKFSENTVVPMFDAYAGDYYVGIWGYLPMDKDAGGYDFDGEWDFFAGRTIKISDLVSMDLGGTLYQYPGVTSGANTFEGFFWLNLALPLEPKLKLYYDFTISNWIGEIMVSRSISLSKQTAFNLTGRVGFRQPKGMESWNYATATLDWVYSFNDRAQFSLGVRVTDNTDNVAVGHGFRCWYGTSIGYSW